jgi:glycine/D-amino acid oxidase-like deaminating enzyme
VLAAGAWSGQLEGLPETLPVRPVKGQMFAVDALAAYHGAGRWRRCSASSTRQRCYIIPRDDGRLLVGATVEDVGFRKGATPRGIAELMSAAMEVLPVSRTCRWSRRGPGSGRRRRTACRILGATPTWTAWCTPPATTATASCSRRSRPHAAPDIVTGRKSPVTLEPFGIERFRGR